MTFAVISRGLWKTPGLEAFFSEGLKFRPRGEVLGVVGWGAKPSAQKAKAWAVARKLPYFSIEDGFIRSVGLGVEGDPPLSIVVDDVGIYYDSTRPSRLEMLIANADDLPVEEAAAAIASILRYRLSKYNHAPDIEDLPSTGRPRVLVVDQTFGDISVIAGGCSAASFEAMVEAALADNPSADIWVKTHPDVLAGKKTGYLRQRCDLERLNWIVQDCNPISLLSQFDRVYTATSQMGFEALMLGKPVTVFGLPWYAGWGLTDDRHPGVGQVRYRRPVNRTVEELFAAAYLRYARYIEPSTGRLGTLSNVVDWIVRNREIRRTSLGTMVCVGMSMWKRSIVKPFLVTGTNRVRFVSRLTDKELHKLPKNAGVVVWGSKHPDLCEKVRKHGLPLLRVEDGFIRSSGLGSDLHSPLSLAVDGPGIYYDPFSQSNLETMLATVSLDDQQCSRVRILRERIIREKITKYNVGNRFLAKQEEAGRRVILVPGQVEDDASIRYGSPRVLSNRDLLATVRCSNPDAWIIYKPHPDVVAGNRRGLLLPEQVEGLADQVALNANVVDCIAAADEVHTMTSLAGFEALIFGKPVHCYGGPFYAGWGLTVDHLPLPHRTRRLQLEELLFVALCQYPRYRLPGVNGFCAVEDVVAHLSAHAYAKSAATGASWANRQWRRASHMARFIFNRG